MNCCCFFISRNAQRLKSGIKKSLGSLRLSPRNRPKMHGRSPGDTVDGPSKPEVPIVSVSESKEEVSSSSSATTAPGSGNQKAKRIILNYHQDTVSLDSVSVSSTSEFSTAGTDDRSTCSPLGDGESSSSGPMDIIGGGERVCLNGGERSLGFSDLNGLEDASLEISESSFRTMDSGMDSGINVDRNTSFSSVRTGKGSSPNRMVGKGSSPNSTVGKGSSRSPNRTAGKGSLSRNTQSSRKEQVVNGPKGALVHTECDLDTQNEYCSKRRDEEFFQSLDNRSGTPKQEDPLSGSGTLSGYSTLKSGTESGSGTLKTEISKNLNSEEIEKLLLSYERLSFSNRETTSCAEPTSNGTCSTTITSDHSLSTNMAAQQPRDKGSGTEGRGYANIFIAKPEDMPGGGVEHPTTTMSRKRSKSNSPYMRKKPKPLPRKSLTNKQILTESMKSELLSSLPANFKPVPLPRPSLFNGKPNTPSKQKPMKAGLPQRQEVPLPHPTAHAMQGVATSNPHRVKPSKNSSLKMEGLSTNSTPRYRSPSGTPKIGGSGNTPQHVEGGRLSQVSSAPCTPRRAGTSNAGGDTPTLPHSTSTPSTPLLESSNPSSPLYGSSTSNLSSDVESSGAAGTASDPIPPPRRKRKSQRYSSQTSKDSLFPVGVLPVSPEESASDQDRLPRSSVSSTEQPDGATGKENQSLGSNSSKSHDLEDSESCRSRDLNEDDLLSSPLLPDESNDVFKDDTTFPSTLARSAVDRNSKFSVSSSNRTSRTSLTVFADTNSSGMSVTMRPYSVMVHEDLNMNGSYDKISESFSAGGHTLPKSAGLGLGLMTWTPRQQRLSVKNMMPASSKLVVGICIEVHSGVIAAYKSRLCCV